MAETRKRKAKRPAHPKPEPVQSTQLTDVKETETDPEDISTWPTRGAAAKFLGVSLVTIKRWQKEERLDSVVDDQEQHRFDPRKLELLKAERTGEQSATDIVVHGAATTVETSTEALRVATRHNEKIMDLVFEPSEVRLCGLQEDLAASRRECETLRERISELQEKIFEMLEKFEAVLSLQHERDLQERQVDAAIKRKDMAIKMLSDMGPLLAPHLLSMLFPNGAGGANDGAPEKLSALLGLVGSLNDEQVGVLFGSEVLTSEQRMGLRKVFTSGQLKIADAAEAYLKKQAENTNGAKAEGKAEP